MKRKQLEELATIFGRPIAVIKNPENSSRRIKMRLVVGDEKGGFQRAEGEQVDSIVPPRRRHK